MRNHSEKIKDMVESVLPSTRARSARAERRLIHHRERARVRAALHQVIGLQDPDDYLGDLHYQDKSSIGTLVAERRAADKVGPLIRWAERTVETSDRLATADRAVRLAHFRALLPDSTIGRHALDHIEWVVAPPDWLLERMARPTRADRWEDPAHAAVRYVLACGAHGELNARIKREVVRFTEVRVRGADGWTIERRPCRVRLLANHVDAAAFVREAGWGEHRVLLALADELARPGAAQ